MQVVYKKPPNYDALISAGFRIGGKKVLFAWGDKIYNPGCLKIPPHLIVHEEMHSWRQGDEPEAWWGSYINDDEFRLEEEILAHQVELRELMRGNTNRKTRRGALHQVAQRLASPLYGSVISERRARLILKRALDA